jgi:hypothetical protein
MWHCVDVVLTDVSEECIASIFRVEGKIRKSESEETARTGASSASSLLAPVLTVSLLMDFLIFPSTLKMEAIRFSETSVNTTSTWCHIPEDCFLQVLNCLSYELSTITHTEKGIKLDE